MSEVLESRNPATDELIRSYEWMSDEEVERTVQASHEAFLSWRKVPFAERARLMRRAGQAVRDNKDEYARLMTQEMGKPITQSRGELEKCAWVCDFYADNAEAFLAPEIIQSDASESFVAHQPLGPVLAIMPWNFPFWQLFRFAAPALMAGNAGLLKHSPNTPGCALAVEAIFRDAGFPEHLFRTLFMTTEQASRVIEHEHVKAVTLTGSTGAGRSVASQAGHEIKKTVLELGGSDPYVILEDADLEAALDACAKSRLINSGQSCVGAKRFIVVEPLVEAFEQGMVQRLEAAKVGDPMEEDTDVGPLARKDLRDKLADQVKRSIQDGARCLTGGHVPAGPGFYYPPTVLTDVKEGMAAYGEEMFGPVASIFRARDEADALRIAADTPYGLGSAVFTRDTARGRRIATEELQAGACFVNAFVSSDPRLPFGGIKASGYGRELSHHGIKEFVNLKTVYVA